MEGPEWNYAALGAKKRELAGSLLQRLQRALRAGRLRCISARASGIRASRCRAGRSAIFWRSDGEPLWRRRQALLADTTRRRARADRGGARFAGGAGAQRSACRRDCVITAYEDVPRLLGEEAALPVNADPLAAGSRGAGRALRGSRGCCSGPRRAGRFRAAAARRREGRRRAPPVWETSPWPLRRERLYAVAGDSPLGLRLPLLAAGGAARGRGAELAVDPFAPRAALPARASLSASARRTSRAATRAAREWSRPRCASQVRDGHLYVFMPPLKRARGLRRAAGARSRTPRAALRAAGAPSKAMRRRAIRACACSASRPTPA